VTPDDRISLKLDLTRDDVTDITLENPPLTTNVVKTELLVEDGETIVIGGIIKADLAESEEGIPGLMKVPGLGYLFKTKGRRDSQTELLIFLTPKIIKLGQKEILG
jgi:type IV pilus assembly protein PilQ